VVEVIEVVKKPFVPPWLLEYTLPIAGGLYVSEWALPHAAKLTQPWAPAQYVRPFAKVAMGIIGMVATHFVAPEPYKKPLYVLSTVPLAMGLLESGKIALGIGPSPSPGGRTVRATPVPRTPGTPTKTPPKAPVEKGVVHGL